MNPNFTSIVATTIKNYRRSMADNITNHQVLWYQLKERGFIQEEDGGTSIVEPLMYGTNTTVKSYRGYEIIDTTPQEGMTAAEYDWKQIAGSVSISGQEEFMNSGKSKMISLLKSKILQLETSLMLSINAQLQADGTGNGGRDLTGLNILVEDGTAWSIVGGIDSNANPYWRNQWIGSVGSFATNGNDRMRTLYNSSSRGKVKPTLLVSTQAVYEAYEKTLVQNERFLDTKLGDAGFLNLMFKATPFVFDDDTPSTSNGAGSIGDLIMINADFMRFVLGKGKNFVMTEFQKPENQDAQVAQLLIYGNLTTNNRQRQGRLTGILV